MFWGYELFDRKARPMNNDKKTLQEAFPLFKLLTLEECLIAIWWQYHKEGDNYKDVMCCGKPVIVGGWIGPEHAHCEICGKGIQDMTGLLPMSEVSASVIDFEKVDVPEDGRVWVPERFW